jgi:2-oxoglutarate ferredoxin oxidoreductase subunit alpha
MFGKDTNEMLIVGWGSSRGAIEEAIGLCDKLGIPASGLHLKIVYPLPLMLKDIFKNYKKVVTVEMAYGDKLKPAPLAMLLRNETCVDVQSISAKATGRPLRPKAIVASIKEALK